MAVTKGHKQLLDMGMRLFGVHWEGCCLSFGLASGMTHTDCTHCTLVQAFSRVCRCTEFNTNKHAYCTFVWIFWLKDYNEGCYINQLMILILINHDIDMAG